MIVIAINVAGIYCFLVASLFFVFRAILKVFLQNRDAIVFKRFYATEMVSIVLAIITAIMFFSVSPH